MRKRLLRSSLRHKYWVAYGTFKVGEWYQLHVPMSEEDAVVLRRECREWDSLRHILRSKLLQIR